VHENINSVSAGQCRLVLDNG